jgi:transcriptional regulator with XRE-family HTH domain
VVHNSLPEQRRRELEELAVTRRAQGRPRQEIAVELAALGGITRLWAWRLAKSWRRSQLLERSRRLGDASVDESMLWRWETGEREPSREHLDPPLPDLPGPPRPARLRPRLQPARRAPHPRRHNGQPAPNPALAAPMASEPLAMVKALTTSAVSTETLAMLERAAARLQRACQAPTAPQRLTLEAIRHYRSVHVALESRQRMAERRRLAAVAARLGSQLGLLLWELDQPAAQAYFDASVVAAKEADDPTLGAWVAERRARAGTPNGGPPGLDGPPA